MNQMSNNNSTFYNDDLITSYYYEVPSLYASTSKAMIALSAVAIIGCHLHYAKYKFITPYMYLHLTSLACLLQAGLQVRIPDMEYATLTSPTPGTAAALASQFFALAFPPLAWCIALEAFRLSQGRAPVRAHRIALALGYLWTLTMIAGAIACVSIYHLSNTETPFIRLYQFVTYGVWVFAVLFIFHSYIVWARVKHFYKSLAVYIVLLILVNVGRTTSLAILLRKQPVNPLVDITTAFKIDFALSKIVGILAIYWAILVCHQWRTIKENNDGVVHDQQIVSVITGDTMHGGIQVEHVVLDMDGEASNKGSDWSKMQISRTTSNEQDNASLETIQDGLGAASSKASSSKSVEEKKELVNPKERIPHPAAENHSFFRIQKIPYENIIMKPNEIVKVE